MEETYYVVTDCRGFFSSDKPFAVKQDAYEEAQTETMECQETQYIYEMKLIAKSRVPETATIIEL